MRTPIDDETAAAILAALNAGRSAEEIAVGRRMLVVDVRAVCGEDGHTYEEYDAGDPATPYYAWWRACSRCGAPDEGEEP